MAGPAVAVLTKILKKIAIDIITDPEKLVKFIMFGVILPLIIIVLVFALPILLMVSVPVLLLNADDGLTEAEILKQTETIAIYQNAPIAVNLNNLKWIEDKKAEYLWCDDVRVIYSFNLTWQDLMAIDAVRFKQDFTNIKEREVIELGESFILKNTYTETYEEEEVRTGTRIVKIRAIIDLNTKSFETIINELNFNEEEKEIALNIYNTIIHADVEGSLNIYDDVDLSELKEYPPGNANIPYYNQADKRWGHYSYGNSTIKSAGCGPTSLAMVIAGLKNRSDINPKSVADWSVANGHRAEGVGSYWSLMTDGGRYYGLQVEPVSRKNPNKVVEALSNGYPVIVSMGRGHFTKGGHFIVLQGITSDGKILVYDPASVSRSQKAWDLGIIMNESSTNGGVNGSPFWIFKP